MKIAVVISGLARFPTQGFAFLERIIQQSTHDIDVYAGLWSIDEIPETIKSKIKKVAVIPYNIRNDCYFLLEKHHLTNNQVSLNCITENHAGLICHMATCTEFKDDLLNYDLVVKWRWDVAIQPDDFDIICKKHLNDDQWFITDDIHVLHGNTVMNDVVFSARPDLMIKAFTPLEDRIIDLGKILQQYAIWFGQEFQAGVLNSITKLISNSLGNVTVVPFRWALLRENILDYPELIHCRDVRTLIKLQQEHDKRRDKK